MNDYAARVARGVLWLDHMHDGWREKVDLQELDVHNGRKCILAQVSGLAYWVASEEMIDDESMAADMGFNASNDELYGPSARMYYNGEISTEEYEISKYWPYAHLENEWRKVLAA